ncbi:hypothetical protein Hdeb2414_s0008g00287691 [Helianthus debilis subsp. tardiflorus]
MDSLPNCRAFYSLSLPPAERLFLKNRHHMDLLDDHIHAGVNYFATTQEIVREWQAMGEDTLEFEATKKDFKLAKEIQFNADRQKEWEVVCERTIRELKAAHDEAARDEIVRLKGEKTKESDEHEHMVVAYQKREAESELRIVALEKVVEEKTTQDKALEIIAEEISTDCKWLLAHGVPLIADRIVKSDDLAKYMFELGGAAYDSGRKNGNGEGRATAVANEKDYHFELHKVDCTAKYTAKRQEYEFLKFGIVRAFEKLTRKGIDVDTLMKALEDEDAEASDASPSHQV